jgi:hypothetical protein
MKRVADDGSVEQASAGGDGVSALKGRRRNLLCPCGSGKKYKRCCLPRDEERARESSREAGLPGWILNSRKKLHQFEKYVCKVYGLPRLLGGLSDKRQSPRVPTFDVVNSLFHTAVLRIPSMNALEGDLKEADFQRLIGRRPTPDKKAFSADAVSDALDGLHLRQVEGTLPDVIFQAERNKAFRDGSYGTLRCGAIDGWEPFCSYSRCCPHCLEREVVVNDETRIQYYHRYVVALLVGPLIDVVIGIEPVRNTKARKEAGEPHVNGDEGEQTAALRLLDKLHATYGGFIDVFIFDGLYPNGPVLTKLTELHYDAIITLRKEDNEPLKEALALWEGQPPCKKVDDPETGEHIEFWDVDGLETLDTYKGKIRVIRGVVTKKTGKTHTWCAAIIGEKARKLPVGIALRALRARWHIENTAFHQWVTYWNLSHVFRHTANATLAVLLLWSLAFNLLQLFIYRRLKRVRRPKDPTDTIRHLVEVMMREVDGLPAPIPWGSLLNTS